MRVMTGTGKLGKACAPHGSRLSGSAGGRAEGAAAGSGAGVLAGAGAGVLEIKCPFNRGNPQAATPPRAPAWYYMPQVGGLTRIWSKTGHMLGGVLVTKRAVWSDGRLAKRSSAS